ncbi:feruloyl-CoA synthase [Sphaerotilus sulfidivorans]|uniref:Feruloyl-CoA synthase n=1 Tax=Sphaerotilus sulfidivorans TaxID=639200 RepID=A0A5C1PY71_9BURK|nr:feruloyl-CoA synthase [Sphaerotilus sulfidivorans]NZD46073.1 feruloyl-CoA synthase [Sphaerotilus sulfidivorans]QEM99373.1 feruloyl-CoA synthase [Sphaerotilus sulfidivorans]
MDLMLFDDAAALAPPRVLREDLPGGGFILRSPEPLQPFVRCIGEWLEHWAQTTPDAVFLAERDATGGWRQLTYRQTRDAVGRLAQAQLDLNLPADKPVVILSDNSVDHALLMLATMHLGRVACTVSSAYCRLTKDFAKIHAILDALDPGLIFASDPGVYGPAVQSWRAARAERAAVPAVLGAQPFAALLDREETPAVMTAFAAIRPEWPAKYLLTSGSTGMPKVVVNSHRMLCANQKQIAQAWPFLTRHQLRLLDWLPWSHTFGGNHNFHMVLAHGGSLWVDEGRPVPGLIEKTVANLRDVRPNFHFNVPRGFDMLLPYLEADEQLARDVIENLEGVFYAGAALPQSLWARLEAVVAKVRNRPLWFTSSWGATETAPAVTSVHWRIDRAGCIGLPLPGVELKLLPNGGKLEIRVRGPNIFSEYRHAPEVTAQAFDADGFYCIGDAAKLLDETRPERGILFDGRVAEDFKLMSGTWVSVGTLRVRAVSALAPHVADVVVTGHGREEIGLLVFPTPQARALPRAELEAHLRAGLHALQAEGGGSSQTPTRALILDEPPSVDAGEITDKGYINQRAVLARRAEAVERLERGGADVLRPQPRD